MEAITFTPAQVQVFNLVSHIKTAARLALPHTLQNKA